MDAPNNAYNWENKMIGSIVTISLQQSKQHLPVLKIKSSGEADNKIVLCSYLWRHCYLKVV